MLVAVRSVHSLSPRALRPKMMCCRHLSCSALLVVLATTLLVLAQDLGGGVNYPTYDSVPPGLSFTCQGRGPGYFADPEAQCQVWHWCLPNGQKFSFLCPNGTVFNQNVRVCDWYYNVDCASAPDRYSINDDLYKDQDGNLI